MKDKNNELNIKNQIVFKDIKRYYNIGHIPYVQNELYRIGLECPQIERIDLISNHHIKYEYRYIKGEKINYLNRKICINILFNLANKMEMICNNNLCGLTYYDKIDLYFMKTKEKHLENRTEFIRRTLQKKYMKIKKLYNCNTLIHGDLDYSNMLWKNNKCYLIDFDECCMAPKGMDAAIFIVRLLIKSIKENAQLNCDFDYYVKSLDVEINHMLIYIIKVIIEKICLEHDGIICIDDEQQKKDSLFLWFDLFTRIEKVNGNR